ncbi:hypothetical protein RclHR1_03570012 [Rhizophagus clarus]|uniref:F-box domain-containing protein n=1 Tax=Rhizophagus clarus TaxID=94130 RepID=A0A2Z6RN03_9GLOM|nr:hypothetical protein RclHR1_03570012 [Rhizophagus clarus]GET02172.1 hypothetical protein GLOIN_2v1781983 [Rhizophagus clarus]
MKSINLDCLMLIFNILQNDKESLYSCLLVNRRWCNIVIPILWKKHPWHPDLNFQSKKKLFNVILSFLPFSSKKLLSDNNIELPSTVLKLTLFNYINFCEFPSLYDINQIINIVLEEFSNDHKRDLLEQEIYKLFVSQCNNVKSLLWNTSQPITFFPGASSCFSELCELCIDIDSVNSNALYELAQICKNLNTLSIEGTSDCSHNLPELISLIDAQRNLKRLVVYIEVDEEAGKELSKALVRNNNTINSLYLCSVKNIVPSSLTSLVNLKNLTICNWKNYEVEVKDFQEYLAISEFQYLSHIQINYFSCFREISLLIEKTKGNILEVSVETTNKTAKNTGMLIKAIANNCPSINFLSTYIEPNDFIHVKSLLKNCRHLKIIRLDSLNFFVDVNDSNIGDVLLDNLAKFSPKSLDNIAISECWKYSIDSCERFFESYRKQTLKSFGIIRYSQHKDRNYITNEHRDIINKYFTEGVLKYADYTFYF